jgi:AcrR family transcriptional regulator
LNAARDLFLAQGYGATTIEQIAQRSGVSKPTVFSAVGNKQKLLATVRDRAIAGDDQPIPIARRPATDRIKDEPDQRRTIQLLVRHLTSVAQRYAPISDMLHGAASNGEASLWNLWRTEKEERLRRHSVGTTLASANEGQRRSTRY